MTAMRRVRRALRLGVGRDDLTRHVHVHAQVRAAPEHLAPALAQAARSAWRDPVWIQLVHRAISQMFRPGSTFTCKAC